MSAIARKFFIASLFYFILGLAVQAVAAFDLWLGFNPLAYTTVNTTEKMLLLGWISQVALALAYERWLQPVAAGQGKVPPSNSMLAVFTLFNLGLPLIILGQPILVTVGGSWMGGLVALGGLLQFGAGLLFLWEVRARLRNRSE